MQLDRHEFDEVANDVELRIDNGSSKNSDAAQDTPLLWPGPSLVPPLDQVAASSSGLWDDIQPYIEQLMGETETDTLALQAIPRKMPRRLATDQEAVLSPSTVADASVASSPTDAVANHPASTDSEPVEYMPEVAMSVRSDVDDIKARYIVGKTVGRDLVDGSGHRLATQGERITHQLVRNAEAAGLLIELIDYMTFDSFED